MRSLQELHDDIIKRHEKAPSPFRHFFLQWLKFNDNSDELFNALGDKGENYLQYRLSLQHVDEAAVIFDRIREIWEERGEKDRIYSFLMREDQDGNGIWHYLAETLQRNEGKATLHIARALLTMDIDFSRRNKFGQSPLCKMLIPHPRWKSLNVLIQTKHLSIEHMENAISERAGDDRARNKVMSFLFQEDIENNEGLLTQHILHQAVQAQADKTLRDATCRQFFDYTDEKKGSSAFFKLIGISNHAMFDDLIRLLGKNTAETVLAAGVADTVTRKAYAQVFLAKRLLKRDKLGEGVLFKALAAKKHMHLAKISSMLRNDELAVPVMVRGERVRKPVVVDKTSRAPNNPLLSLLLQQDTDGNTVFHLAVAIGDLRGLKSLTSGLATNDLFAIINDIPNNAGLTLYDMTCDPGGAKKNLFVAAKAKRINGTKAKMMAEGLMKSDPDVKSYIETTVNEITELAKFVGRKEPLPPSFELPKTRNATVRGIG